MKQRWLQFEDSAERAVTKAAAKCSCCRRSEECEPSRSLRVASSEALTLLVGISMGAGLQHECRGDHVDSDDADAQPDGAVASTL